LEINYDPQTKSMAQSVVTASQEIHCVRKASRLAFNPSQFISVRTFKLYSLTRALKGYLTTLFQLWYDYEETVVTNSQVFFQA